MAPDIDAHDSGRTLTSLTGGAACGPFRASRPPHGAPPMAITHATATRTAIANAVLAALDAGAAAGSLIVRTSANATLTTHTLSDPSGSVAAGVLTFSAIGDGTVASGGGTADNFIVQDSDANLVFSGSVSTTAAGTGDLQFDSVTWAEGGTVSISSGTYTAPS